MKCPDCNTALNPSWNTCPSCGKAFGQPPFNSAVDRTEERFPMSNKLAVVGGALALPILLFWLLKDV